MLEGCQAACPQLLAHVWAVLHVRKSWRHLSQPGAVGPLEWTKGRAGSAGNPSTAPAPDWDWLRILKGCGKVSRSAGIHHVQYWMYLHVYKYLGCQWRGHDNKSAACVHLTHLVFLSELHIQAWWPLAEAFEGNPLGRSFTSERHGVIKTSQLSRPGRVPCPNGAN